MTPLACPSVARVCILLEAQDFDCVEFALVVYYTRSSYSLCHLERYDWSSDITAFDSLLKTVHISGGGNSGSCLPEALSEALCLFQSPSRLSQADSSVKHCLVFSLTEAHNMAADWPFPLASASSDKASRTASFAVGMAEAFRRQAVSLSVFTTYPPGQNNFAWPSRLCKLFEHAEEGEVVKVKSREEQQEQQQQRMNLRKQCSVGLQSSHFVLLSKQWGEATVQLFQGQRNKRKAAQAFEGAPLNGFHKQVGVAEPTQPHPPAKADLLVPDRQSFPFQTAVPSAVPNVPLPKAGPLVLDWQGTPKQAAAPPQSPAGVPAAVPTLSQGSHQPAVSHDSSPAIDLSSPQAKPRSIAPIVVDLTEEEPPVVPDARALPPLASLVMPQLQHQQPQLQPGFTRSMTPPPAVAGQPPTGVPAQQHLVSRQQQPPLQQAQVQQRQPPPSPASANHHTLSMQQQQQQRPGSAPVDTKLPVGQRQQQQPSHQAPASQQTGRLHQHQQQQHAVNAVQSRPMSAPLQGGAQSIMQAQQQLQQRLPQQQQHQQQQPHASAQVVNAGRMQPLQNPTVQQIQDVQSQLKLQQEQAQKQGQGQSGAGQPAIGQGQITGTGHGQGQYHAGPKASQARPQQDQGYIQPAPGQFQQVYAQGSQPMQGRAGQGQLVAGQPSTALPQSQHGAVMSTASSTASARPSSNRPGMPTIIWQGKVFAAAAVVKRPQDTLMLECKLGVQQSTWPSGLEQGWGQHLVVNKLVALSDITKLLGQEVLSRTPRVGLALGTITELGMSFIRDMAAKKVMAIIQLPHRGKFLGLITGPASSNSSSPVPHKLVGLLLTLQLPQQSKQQQQKDM